MFLPTTLDSFIFLPYDSQTNTISLADPADPADSADPADRLYNSFSLMR